ncbi:MAG: ferrochelatase [Actinomycetota bacterium]|nr:ferrochelatase [Actinomycetota bacterium]
MDELDGPFDAVLLVAFGGPESPDEVEPFLARVTADRPIPPERVAEVADRYLSVGGVSPLNGRMRALLDTVEARLTERSIALPVFWGNRNADPLLAEALVAMRDAGVQRALAWLASPYASYSTCRQYRENIEDARLAVGSGAPRIDVLRRHHDHPLLVAATADRLADALRRLPADRRDRAQLLFSAHSIPTAMSTTCDYVAQLHDLADLVANLVDPDGHLDREVVWQSRSGSPQVPWLEPDVGDRIDALAAVGVDAVVVSPLGFPVENFEIAWDLDVEAAQRAADAGVAFERAGAADDDPRFADMVVDLVAERLEGRDRRASSGSLGVWPDDCPAGCCPAPGIPGPRRPEQ